MGWFMDDDDDVCVWFCGWIGLDFFSNFEQDTHLLPTK